jgi:hypothetical protein
MALHKVPVRLAFGGAAHPLLWTKIRRLIPVSRADVSNMADVAHVADTADVSDITNVEPRPVGLGPAR